MKVLDLRCPQDHVFEAWFGSETDFRRQMESGLLECPLCGSKALHKALSAPRLNLGALPPKQPSASKAASSSTPVQPSVSAERQRLQAMQAAWLEVSRHIAATTEDVGNQFADEARRMHQGQEPERPIRGQATVEQAQELIEEGVPVWPLALPAAAKTTLQ